MAEQNDRSMIGYDPLAWLHDEDGKEVASNQQPTISTEGFDQSETVKLDATNEVMNSELQDGVSLENEQNSPQLSERSAEEHIAEPLHETQDLEIAVESEDEFPDLAPAELAVASNAELVLNGSQTIQNVGELHEQLQRLLDSSNKIDIDASAVTQIDTATMQLLLVLKLTATKLQKQVNIDFPSDRFLEAANLLGVAEMLSVDQAASGFF